MALSYFRELRQYANPKIFAVLATITLVALGSMTAVIYCLHTVLRVRQESIQITKIQTQLSNYYVELLSAETGQRGYLLTGDEAYLGSYDKAAKQLPGEGKALVAQSSQYGYADKMKEIQAVAGKRLDRLEAGIVLRREQGPEAAESYISEGQGRDLMNQLRGLLGDISQQQATELADKRTVATQYGQWANMIAASTMLLIVILVAFVYYLFLQAIKAERALDQAKDEFVSLASHQLRTPATSIKSVLSMLRSSDFGPLNERQSHVVDLAIVSNERGIRIVEELLSVAQADAGRLILKPARVDIGELVKKVVVEQRAGIDTKKQHLSITVPGQAVELMADEEKLHMAIGNLLDNASKYTPEGGRIAVTVRSHARSVDIELADSGRGIDRAEMANIFDRFQRAHDILMSGTEGTGLGLYLARNIARLHHGSIKVTSKKGKGSVFTLSLPRT